jgi:flavodoxin
MQILSEPTNSATTVTEYICKEAKAAVETAACKIVPKVKQSNNKKHAQKNDSGNWKAQKRVKISSIENDTNTKDGRDSKPNGKQKKKKMKPKSILRSGKFQGGSKQQRQQRKQKEKEQSKLMQPFLPSDPSVSPQRVLDTLYTTNEENVHNIGFTVDPT